MTGSTKERLERLRDLVCTVEGLPKGATFTQLKALCCRSWAISGRTAEEYLQVLIDGGLLAYDPPGGPLKVTPAGHRWLFGKLTEPDANEGQLTLIRAPSPPSSPTGGEVEQNAGHPEVRPTPD